MAEAWQILVVDDEEDIHAVTRLALKTLQRRPTRSLLVTGVVACAVFLIVAVGANRHAVRPVPGRDTIDTVRRYVLETARVWMENVSGSGAALSYNGRLFRVYSQSEPGPP